MTKKKIPRKELFKDLRIANDYLFAASQRNDELESSIVEWGQKYEALHELSVNQATALMSSERQANDLKRANETMAKARLEKENLAFENTNLRTEIGRLKDTIASLNRVIAEEPEMVSLDVLGGLDLGPYGPSNPCSNPDCYACKADNANTELQAASQSFFHRRFRSTK